MLLISPAAVCVTLNPKSPRLPQGLRIASRCLWDTTTDNFASECYENETLCSVAQVYGLYYE